MKYLKEHPMTSHKPFSDSSSGAKAIIFMTLPNVKDSRTNILCLFALSQQHSDIKERAEIEESELRCFQIVKHAAEKKGFLPF